MKDARLLAVFLCALSPALGAQDQPSTPEPFRLVEAAWREGRADDAVKLGEEAVLAMPDSAIAHVWLGRAVLLKLERVSFLSKIGLSKRARKEFDRALELDSSRIEVREARARYFANAPGIAGGDKQKARAEAEAARRIDPYRGGLLRGQVEERDKQVAAAAAEYAALLEAHPDSVSPFNRLVNLHQYSKQYSEAFQLIDQRLALHPHEDLALYHLGRNAALSGEQLERGEAALREFLALGKFEVATEAQARWRLGAVLEHRGDRAGALVEYQAAASLDSTLEEAAKAAKRLTERREPG
jgi:tetratricopeptide (TPR) repeat protein